MKLQTLAVAALIALAGPALAQTPAPKEPVKNEKAQAAKKDVKKDAKSDKAATKTESTPKK